MQLLWFQNCLVCGFDDLCLQFATPTPFTPESIEHLFTTSTILKTAGVIFQPKDEKTWLLTYKNREYMITFYPNMFDEIPSLRLMNFGEPLFAEFLQMTQNLSVNLVGCVTLR